MGLACTLQAQVRVEIRFTLAAQRGHIVDAELLFRVDGFWKHSLGVGTAELASCAGNYCGYIAIGGIRHGVGSITNGLNVFVDAS